MLITNIDAVENKTGFKKPVADWLIYIAGIPLLGIKDDFYYFANTEILAIAIENIPTRFKVADL